MYENTVNRDLMRSEIDYRFDRIRSELAGRRVRRSLSRRGTVARRGDAGDVTFGTTR